MKQLLKNILKPLYHFALYRNEREFYILLNKWGNTKRHFRIDGVRFLKYKFDVPDLPSFIWQFKEIFVDHTYKFIPSCETPVIYDCGANIGMACLYFKTIAPKAKIIAFEADPNIGLVLKNNLKKNNILGVEVIDKAIWINNEGVSFSVEGADGGSIHGGENKVHLGSVRLKDYLMREETVDFLKVDIEGAEIELFKDCRENLNYVRNIYIEYHSFCNDEQKLSELLTILEECNFRYYINGASSRKEPFINKSQYNEMDLQLHICAYKI